MEKFSRLLIGISCLEISYLCYQGFEHSRFESLRRTSVTYMARNNVH